MEQDWKAEDCETIGGDRGSVASAKWVGKKQWLSQNVESGLGDRRQEGSGRLRNSEGLGIVGQEEAEVATQDTLFVTLGKLLLLHKLHRLAMAAFSTSQGYDQPKKETESTQG